MADSKYLKGCDVSLWQYTTQIVQPMDFVIVKASEGNNIKDPKFNQHLQRCKDVGIGLVGAYHYARVKDNVDDDIRLFLTQVESRGELGHNMLLALDLEGEDINQPNAWDWARAWLDGVYAATGIKPVLYISGSYTPKGKNIIAGDYGLWVAHWDVKKPKIGAWPFWALWQYHVANNILDLDYFNGSKEQFLAYCKSDKI